MSSQVISNHRYAVLGSSKILHQDDIDRITAAVQFLQAMKPTDFSPMELEYAIMHTAFVVNEENKFKDNYNIDPDRRNQFSDHVEKVLESDIYAWIRKLYDFAYWRYDNLIVCNLVWNWLNGSLDEPTGIL
jgi:hypothetical protein